MTPDDAKPKPPQRSPAAPAATGRPKRVAATPNSPEPEAPTPGTPNSEAAGPHTAKPTAARPATAKPTTRRTTGERTGAKPASPPPPVKAPRPTRTRRAKGLEPIAALEPATALATATAPPDPSPTKPPVAPPAEPGRRRILVTGATGFVGRAVVTRLLERGDHVVAPVRDPGRARDLADEGVEVLGDDLSSVQRLAEHLHECDGAIHAAGSYRVGITREERGAMWDANVGVTTRFLDAAELAATPRIVYVSTVNVFGNTKGRIVDEKYRRNLAEGFLSWYDETKYGAHEVAEQRVRSKAPVVVVLPSQVYGPRDHSAFGGQLRDASQGRLRYRAVDDLGVGLVHVEDLAAGIVAALDKGAIGQQYILSGPTTRLRDAIALAAATSGKRAPRLRLPTRALRLLAPVGGAIGQPNLREVLSASAGVTYWASSAKAEEELAFRARDLETGFRDTFGRP